MATISYLKRSISEKLWTGLSQPRRHLLLRRWYGGQGCILCFHRVVPESSLSPLDQNRSLEVTPSQLRNLISFFRNSSYDIIPLGEVLKRLQSPSRKRFVVFTFDDGYADNYTLAFPIFRELEIPFTLYVATGFPEQTVILWWYVLEKILMAKSEIEFEGPEKRFHLSTATLPEKNEAFSEIKKLILSNGDDFCRELMKKLGVHSNDLISFTRQFAISWTQLSEMAQSPYITIGSHTVGHPNLLRLDENESRTQMRDSKNLLEQNLGVPIEHFCYPYGLFRDRDTTLARETGYLTATSTRLGNLFTQHRGKAHSLPRIVVNGGTEVIPAVDQALSGFPLLRKHQLRRLVF